MTSPHTVNWLALGMWQRSHSAPNAQEGRHGLLPQVWRETAAVLLSHKMNTLLLLLPLAIVSHASQWPAGVTFSLALLPLCSLAERLGMITEQLALYTNDTLGGLLNATFGNATEVIIAAFAIKKGFLRVVKLTLLGSIISNLLLVMGSAFVAGGLVHPLQRFNQQGINVNCGLLILAVVAVMLPTLLSSTAEGVKDGAGELALSRFESVLMLVGYGLFLVFQLVTHRHLYEEDGKEGGGAAAAAAAKPPAPLEDTSCVSEDVEAGAPARQQQHAHTELELSSMPGSSSRGGAHTANGTHGSSHSGSSGPMPDGSPAAPHTLPLGGGLQAAAAAAGGGGASATGADDCARLLQGQQPSVQVVDEEEEEQVLSWAGCFVWLALVTAFISILSDYIMDAITDASKQLRVPMPFLTTIVVPIVGNAAEHASALIFAVKNRMEISLGVAMGSSTQIGVLVVPFCVVLAWALGQPLDLNFNEFEALVLFISVLLAAVVVQDGTSNWLKGAMLILTYIFVAAGFWVHKDPSLKLDADG